MMRKAQLQTLEPILIVIFLALILGLVLLFSLRISDTSAQRDTISQGNRQDLALLGIVANLPEIACPRSETSKTYCIDEYKARAFNASMRDVRKRNVYFQLLGNTRISIQKIDGASDPLVIYQMINDTSDVRTSFAYSTIHDPVTDLRSFAIVRIERGVR